MRSMVRLIRRASLEISPRKDVRGLLGVIALLLSVAAAPVPLANSRLKLETSEDFEVMTTAGNGERVTLRANAGKLLVLLEITRDPETESSKAIEALLSKLRKEGKLLNAEVIQPATIVETPLIAAKVIDTIKVEGRTSSRSLSTRRVVGYGVEMFAIATSDSDAEREAMLTKAEDELLRKVTTGSAPRSDTARDKRLDLKIGLTAPFPDGWVLKATSSKEGVVARGEKGSSKIVIVVTPITRAAEGTEDDFLTAADTKALATEDEALGLPGLDDPRNVQDGRFFLRQRRQNDKLITDRRVRRLGNALVSVALSATREDYDPAAKTADAIAVGITPK